MKKGKSVSTAYDEASSGSDSEEDSSDDGSSSAPSDDSSSSGDAGAKNQLKPIDSEDDEGASDSDSDSDSENVEEPAKRGASSHGLEESEEDKEPSSDEDNDDEADLPLQERIQRREAQGLSLHKQRERKRSALETASERLAKYKRSKNEEDDSFEPADDAATGDRGPEKKKKKSKHAPTEASSKRSDFYRRGAPRLNESGVGVEIGARRYKPMDPRTSSLSGHLNEEQFENNYEFLQDMRNKEIAQLKKKISARKQTGKKGKRMRHRLNVSVADGSVEEDEEHLRRLKQERADYDRRKVVRTAKQNVKKKIQSEVEEGKRGAFFLKRKEKKQLEFEAKMEELRKQRGGHKAVEKALAKRRQKAKSRDAGLFVK